MKIQTIENGLSGSLKKDFKTKDLAQCLKNIGVLDSSDVLKSYQDITAWQRGCAQTYISVANIITQKGETKFIAKALVSMATKPSQQIKNWNLRREVVNSIGIRTAKNFSIIKGIIYEEFIDNKFTLSNNLPKNILEQLAFVAGQLDKKGFISLSFSNDIRVKKNILYYIDFGFDLGEPSAVKSNSAYSHLQKNLDNDQMSFIKSIYCKILTG